MKAIVYRRYGSPDVLHLEEVETPTPHDDEVLVRTRAASINSWDYDLLRGARGFTRMSGLFRPRNPILGTDVAGRVEAVGSSVNRLQPGDEVFGEVSKRFVSLGWGGLAEFVSVRESSMLSKPSDMTFEQAAAIPQVGALAMAGLRHGGGIQPGQKVLVNGAGGGVGTFAVQIAKHHGAEVTGVDSPEKLDMLRSIGADHVIDYTQEDFTRNWQRYDLIIDVAAYGSTFDYKRALAPGGTYGVIGGSQPRFFQTMFLGRFISLLSSKKMGTVVAKPNEGLDHILELFAEGVVKPVIDRTYPLSETADAFRYFGEGRVQGKIVITI
ncbi:MAG: NAD(P)-dependent alcohol dehydrogenase [Dehalococcoidia bacterium]|jgi:NADPH:quinone reductase-like Zn-dependent oxidoreductase|nr:NAD(P)-dependent alcohol dehydrogenase [Dehalococcoidia bacterium]